MQKLPIHNRARQDLFTLVDDYDYERFKVYRWRINSRTGYVIRSFTVDGKEHIVSLHRAIMQPPPELVVDHIDHNIWNNQRSNLRVISQQQNLMNRRMFANNSSHFKGVVAQHGRWHAQIEVWGKTLHMGFYDDPKRAALAYDAAVLELYGDVGWRNFPDEAIPDWLRRQVRDFLRVKCGQRTGEQG